MRKRWPENVFRLLAQVGQMIGVQSGRCLSRLRVSMVLVVVVHMDVSASLFVEVSASLFG